MGVDTVIYRQFAFIGEAGYRSGDAPAQGKQHTYRGVLLAAVALRAPLVYRFAAAGDAAGGMPADHDHLFWLRCNWNVGMVAENDDLRAGRDGAGACGLLSLAYFFLAVDSAGVWYSAPGGWILPVAVEEEIVADLNELIHQPIRLRIMAMLVTLDSDTQVGFTSLKEMLNLTDGNLGAHLKKLEEAGYIRIEKTFINNKPYTYIAATERGKQTFAEHVAALEAILQGRELA